ncbi:hypothetical protein E2C01_075092 [Portunus trituberculatus]|uniref:Uncharacterized protein n=1 Tax=Portunus trituberculatus TaxID=210409 RepID=A0A5B7I9U0_PORTR|nr:hypothetical protein [Portunus trituberculatus]
MTTNLLAWTNITINHSTPVVLQFDFFINIISALVLTLGNSILKLVSSSKLGVTDNILTWVLHTNDVMSSASYLFYSENIFRPQPVSTGNIIKTIKKKNVNAMLFVRMAVPRDL